MAPCPCDVWVLRAPNFPGGESEHPPPELTALRPRRKRPFCHRHPGAVIEVSQLTASGIALLVLLCENQFVISDTVSVACEFEKTTLFRPGCPFVIRENACIRTCTVRFDSASPLHSISASVPAQGLHSGGRAPPGHVPPNLTA